MAVVKKLKLNSIEKGLEDIVSLCSRIKISQEELSYIEQKVNENRKDFSGGTLSESKYMDKEKDLKRESLRLSKNIDSDIKKSIKKIDSVKQTLNKIEI
ncbi:MAG: hypothetical protein V1818_01455 [Candidatus Aenigmatarchaeota archaeon]